MGKLSAIGLLALCACATTPVRQDPARSSARSQDMIRQIQHDYPCRDGVCAGNPNGVK